MKPNVKKNIARISLICARLWMWFLLTMFALYLLSEILNASTVWDATKRILHIISPLNLVRYFYVVLFVSFPALVAYVIHIYTDETAYHLKKHKPDETNYSQRRTSGKRSVYFHEDFYCQRQLFPNSSMNHVIREIDHTTAFAEAHRWPDGTVQRMYWRKEPSFSIPGLKIHKKELGDILSKHLPPYEEVYSGYSTFVELCKNTGAWGLANDCVIFADWSDDGIVKNIWAQFFDLETTSVEKATEAIASLGEKYALIYVDWEWKYICRASNKKEFSTLLIDKLQTINHRRNERVKKV